jgi:hypothetical protein
MRGKVAGIGRKDAIFEARNVACHDDQVAIRLPGGFDQINADIEMQVTAQGNALCGFDPILLGFIGCENP